MMHWLMMATAAFGLNAQPPVPALPQQETIDYSHDLAQRMTVPVSVGGRGPFRFVVDTGAERTVISRELAHTLQLDAGRAITLSSLADVRQVPSVFIPQLEVGQRTVAAIRAPALAERNIGAQGILGIDSLQNQRVVIDFGRRELRLTRSHIEQERWPSDTVVVRAQTRLGRMVLTDVRIDGQRVTAIVDTGSPITIGNSLLRDRLVRGGRIDPNQMMELTSVTGASLQVNWAHTRRLRIGTAQIHDLPVAFADAQLFRQLGLADRPAILLGMDVLQLFDRVMIDFATRRLQLLQGPRSNAQGLPRMAAR